VDFDLTPRAKELYDRLQTFMDEKVYPAESVYEEQLAAAGIHEQPQVMEDLKAAARKAGLWNLFLPHATEWGGGLSNLDYAPLAELSGRSMIGPEALNCSPPDTGNMELLTMFGTDDQKAQWLAPLLDGTMRSAFLMTEPEVAGSDATNIACSIVRDGDDYVINGRKWWISGAADPRCRLGIVMGKTDPDAPTFRQQSMILVPFDSPGVEVVRDLLVLGYNHKAGHCEVTLTDVRVPASNILGSEGSGFEIAQARLGPGRIHHCMRSIGAAERALELMCRRAKSRIAFGRPLGDQGLVQKAIADSRIEIEQARLLTYHAAWLMDRHGNKVARAAISAIKVAVPAMASRVLDRSMQVHGGAGLSQDFPMAEAFARQRALRLLDGPDEVHLRTVARHEMARYADA